jgi:hypothetical protein
VLVSCFDARVAIKCLEISSFIINITKIEGYNVSVVFSSRNCSSFNVFFLSNVI